MDTPRAAGGVAAWIGDAPELGRLIAAAAVVGALGAATAIGVRFALTEGLAWLYGTGDVVSGLAALPAWQRVLAPAAGGIVAGLVVSLLIRRGSQGVADVMEAVALGRGRPRLGAAAGQAVGTIAAQLGGGSIGREGPMIQLGAGVGHHLAVRVTESLRERLAMVAAGTAAGFAAAYNTPIAAVLFVLEVVIGVATVEVLIPVAVAAAIGTALTRVVVGGGPIYGARAFELVSTSELIAFGALAVIAALGAVGFMQLLAAGERVFARLAAWPRAVRAGIGGLVVGAIAWQLPAVAGNGYEPLRAILDGGVALDLLLILCVAKAIATTASVTSGSPGGVFTPTMLIGATLGAATGDLVARIAPFGDQVVAGGYALVGMAAAVAAVTHAPLMATVLVFELTGDYAIVLPLLLTTAVSTLLSRRLHRDSIYTAELRRRGIPWEGTVAERLAHAARARDLMEPDPLAVPATTPLDVALSRLAESRGRLLYVIDDGPVRAISLTTAKALWAAALRGEPLPVGQTAGQLATPVTTVGPADTLLQIGEKLWNVDWGELPVVDPAAPHRPLGTVTRRGLLGAFDRELLQRDVLTTRVASADGLDYLELPDGHKVAVVPVPAWLVGRIPDLAGLSRSLAIKLIAVRRDPGGEAPPRWHDADAGFALAASDRLMVIGTNAEIDRLATGPDPAA
jgi:CIC family chloride channel protein